MSPILSGVIISRTKDNVISTVDYKSCKQTGRTKGYLNQISNVMQYLQSFEIKNEDLICNPD